MIPEKCCVLTWQKLAVSRAAYAISALMAFCRRVDTARVRIAYPATLGESKIPACLNQADIQFSKKSLSAVPRSNQSFSWSLNTLGEASRINAIDAS